MHESHVNSPGHFRFFLLIYDVQLLRRIESDWIELKRTTLIFFCFFFVLPRHVLFLFCKVVCCYLVMVVYHIHFLDRAKVYRYMGFAQQAYRELVQPQQVRTPTYLFLSNLYVRSTYPFLGKWRWQQTTHKLDQALHWKNESTGWDPDPRSVWKTILFSPLVWFFLINTDSYSSSSKYYS